MPLETILQDLTETPSSSWNQLPDIELYLDQVITYLSRDQIKGCPEADLTPSMVNNYVKEKLLPRANGKKYNREHLVYLRMINALKQVYNVKEIKGLLDEFTAGKDPEDYHQAYQASLQDAANQVKNDIERLGREDLAMQLAIQSVVYKLVSKRLFESNPPPKK